MCESREIIAADLLAVSNKLYKRNGTSLPSTCASGQQRANEYGSTLTVVIGQNLDYSGVIVMFS
jgi:hypothetical protein